MWELYYKESWAPRTDAFELWCWRRLLRVPSTARRSNQAILEEINAEHSLERLMLKLKLQYFGHWPPDVKNWFIRKDPDAGQDWRQEEKGMTEDEMAGWHHRLKGPEFEQAPGVSGGQGSLVCCSSWGRRLGHNWVTEVLLFLKKPKYSWFAMFQVYSRVIQLYSYLYSFFRLFPL